MLRTREIRYTCDQFLASKEIKPAVRSNYVISQVDLTSSTLMERAEWNLSKSIVTWLTRAVLEWQLSVMKVRAGGCCEGLVAEAPIFALSTTRRLTWLNWRTWQPAHCEQLIKHECYHSRLLYNGDMYGLWVSRVGENVKYWGGVDYVDYECTCLNNIYAQSNIKGSS